MKERGILFSAPMVRALLAGTKTQTRRPMSLQPSEDTTVHVERFNQTVIDRHGDEQPGPEVFGAWWHDGESGLRCPYGAPGDRLWVREAWRSTGDGGRCNSMPPRDMQPHDVWYEADGLPLVDECAGKLRPSMFMPRWASRILLEVTEVRVERLQDISEADAKAEGAHMVFDGDDAYRRGYGQVWEKINGPGSWAANPWVWAVSFRRITP